MNSKLARIAFTGIAVCAVCLGAAAALGAGHMDGIDLSFLGDRPRCETIAGAKATSRDLDWDGSDHVTLSVPANATYAPGGDAMVHVRGDAQTLAHLRVRDGHIEMDCNSGWGWHESRVTIALPGRQFQRFAISGSGDMVLQKLDQNALKTSISGSGSIRGEGKVRDAELHISGSGSIDFGKVTGETARVHISGSGDADIAPRREAEIHISGSGDVNLHSNPAIQQTHISGSGRIRNLGS